jgi:hypothetical protein
MSVPADANDENLDLQLVTQDERPGFEKELQSLINRYSKENGSNTPDFILADYMANCLSNFNAAVLLRSKWYNQK